MYYLFLEILNFIRTRELHLFMVFSIYVWSIWLIKFYYSRKYKPYRNDYDEKISVVIPVLKEDLKVFENCLSSVRKQTKKSELIVVIDDGDNDIENLAKKYADKVMSYEWRGKRPSIADGFRASTGDILILMDSDTYYDSEKGIEVKSWDSTNFAGFWYDIDEDEHTEQLNILKFKDNRSIDKNNIQYITTRSAQRYL